MTQIVSSVGLEIPSGRQAHLYSGPSSALRFFSKFLVFAVLCLIFIGSLVTSHDAGLSVPDWPTTYGQNMFLFPYESWIGGIFYEHGHRLLASAIGALTVILTAWITLTEKRRWVKILSWCALAAVVTQGVLGGLTVILGLPDAVSVSHAVLGQSFFVLTICIAYFLSAEWCASSRENSNPQLFRSTLLVAGLIYLQLIVGALMRHAAAGLAIPDFPTMGGSWVPTVDNERLVVLNEMRRGLGLPGVNFYQAYSHLIHRALGVFITLAVFVLALRTLSLCKNSARLRLAVKLMVSIVMVQFTLGATTVLTQRAPYVASLHVLFGALLLGLAVLTALRAYPKAG